MKRLGLAALLACSACLPAQPIVRTTIETRDPNAVTVASEAPWNGRETHVARDPSGALIASSPDEPSQLLMNEAGTIALTAGTPVNAEGDPLAAWIDYSAPGEGTRGTPKILSQVLLSTPRSNVVRITENRRPGRGGVTAGLFIGMGTFFLAAAVGSTYDAATTNAPAERVATIILATLFTYGATYGIVEGIYRIVGGEENRTVYRAGNRP